MCSVVRQRQRPRGLISPKCPLQYVCRHRIQSNLWRKSGGFCKPEAGVQPSSCIFHQICVNWLKNRCVRCHSGLLALQFKGFCQIYRPAPTSVRPSWFIWTKLKRLLKQFLKFLFQRFRVAPFVFTELVPVCTYKWARINWEPQKKALGSVMSQLLNPAAHPASLWTVSCKRWAPSSPGTRRGSDAARSAERHNAVGLRLPGKYAKAYQSRKA